MGLWYPLIAWLFPHVVVPRRLIAHRRREVAAIRERGDSLLAAEGVFKTHIASESREFLSGMSACGAATHAVGGSADGVDCHACLRIVRRAKEAQA